jgi:hypothetical protein
MKKVLRLTESDLIKLVKRIVKEEESSKDLYTLLHSLRNSVNDENKRESLSKLEDILSIVRDMEDKHKSKRNIKEDVSSTPTTTQKTISLDCARKTADSIALTTQQVDRWCPKAIVKPSPQPTQSNPTQQSGTAI